ncbi:MAG: hypothetical protein IT368_01315, partial [Candidatus Hydrogenedentes bacterium]|nr:hypothetical protein [Candidatus Hydrogenedentota bacterium]
TQLKVHLARLAELEYLVAHRTKASGFEYELVYDAVDADALRFPGLADIEALRHAYDGARSGSEAGRSAPGRAAVGHRSVGGRDDELAAEPHGKGVSDESAEPDRKMHCSPAPRKSRSYPQAVPSLAA